MGFFESAEALAAGSICGEDAVASVDDGCHELSVAVAVAYSLFFYHSARGGSEVVKDLGEGASELRDFFGQQWSSGVAIDAALAQTAVQVAAEVVFYDVEGYDFVVDEQHCR